MQAIRGDEEGWCMGPTTLSNRKRMIATETDTREFKKNDTKLTAKLDP